MTRETLRFVVGPEHDCGYLPGRRARNIYFDPRQMPGPVLHSLLSEYGFRRSGPYLYRPHCVGCQACVPARIPVASFRPNRSQRRTRNRNRDLTLTVRSLHYSAEHFALYRRYTASRHPGGGMDDSSPEQYLFFLRSQWSGTLLWEFRHRGRLLAVAVVDDMPDALSAVYTFFDPDVPQRGLGNYAVLCQIDEARRQNLRWLYLGYWIAGHAKMGYKTRFRPLELLTPRGWERIEHGQQPSDTRGGRFS